MSSSIYSSKLPDWSHTAPFCFPAKKSASVASIDMQGPPGEARTLVRRSPVVVVLVVHHIRGVRLPRGQCQSADSISLDPECKGLCDLFIPVGHTLGCRDRPLGARRTRVVLLQVAEAL